MTSKCEYRQANETCPCRAHYHVKRKYRVYDGQDSCGRHLAATVEALAEGQPSEIVVTLKREGGQ